MGHQPISAKRSCLSTPQRVCSVEPRQNCSHEACSRLRRPTPVERQQPTSTSQLLTKCRRLLTRQTIWILTNNTASSDLPLSPTVTGSGEIVSWAISPSVPSGLAFSTSTGVLSGTPTELLTRSMFTITATNTGGTATAYINITIVDEVPTIAYSPNDLDLMNNTASSDLPLSPTVTGSGEIVSWAISPSVPSGLAFDTSTVCSVERRLNC